MGVECGEVGIEVLSPCRPRRALIPAVAFRLSSLGISVRFSY